MAYTTIDDPSAHFHVNLHSGNGTNNTDITFDANAGDFQPDFIWFKGRTSSAIDHALFDSSRGTTKILNSNNNNDENAQGATLKAFNSNGFRVGDDAGDYGVNANGRTYVTWNWKANGGTTTTNDASSTGVGTIDSVYQANTTAGFSIVTHTGSGSAGNIAHGLGVAPEWVITKNRTDDNQSWANYHVGVGNEYYLELDTTDTKETASSVWGDTTPSTTTFRVGGANGKNNASSKNYVSYCFTPIQGYSKFGSYIANNSTDGPFIYLGFKPAWIMVKNTSAAADWPITDNKREAGNPFGEEMLFANGNDVETNYTGGGIDFLSNGFKIRSSGTNGVHNANNTSHVFVYMAFAEHPFVSSKGVPVTAR